jgi:hypothetical protein
MRPVERAYAEMNDACSQSLSVVGRTSNAPRQFSKRVVVQAI